MEKQFQKFRENPEVIPAGTFLGGEEIPAGGWRATRDVYRTEDGDHYYEFEFHDVGSNYEIDIKSTPSYKGRDTDPHKTHVLPSDRGGKRICFGNDSDVDSMSKARKYAESWAENTSDYIKHGDRF
jgi:hypothetical protein